MILLTILQEQIITVDLVWCGDGVNHTPGKSSHHYCNQVLSSDQQGSAMLAVLSSAKLSEISFCFAEFNCQFLS